MMKALNLFHRVLLLLPVSLLFLSCSKEPCLDMARIDEFTLEMQQWYVDSSHQQMLLKDRNGISQTLLLSAFSGYIMEGHVMDDCGNSSKSYYHSLQYTTSLSPLHFMIDISGAAPGYGGYKIVFNCMRTNGDPQAVKAVFDFEKAAAADKDDQIIVHHNKNMNGIHYEQLMEVVFDTDQSGFKAVRRLWFAPLYGIVAFEDRAGNLHQREVL
jgi:hypothetical protein